jgi:hypothetical protein
VLVLSLKCCGQSMTSKSSQHSDESFLLQLERQAAKQAALENNRFFPKQLDVFTAFVGTHAWQVVCAASLVTAAILEVL